MKLVILFAFCLSSAFALPSPLAEAEACTADKCKREEGCVCASSNSPIDRSKTPQFVTCTIDDSLRADIYDNYVAPLFLNRKNPDGKPISATFYVPHQYTDYEKINELYNKGFEIGVNSISKDIKDYWEKADTAQLVKEMDGQRTIISKFANIPADDIKGARTPHFQLAGDRTFKAYSTAKLTHDNSFTALSSNPLYPFTLKYRVDQQCLIGECPTESYPNTWIVPIVNFIGADNNQCNVLISCGKNGTATEIRDWLITQYNRHYNGHRAPISLLVTSSWFETEPNSFEAFKLFLDYLGTNKDTFLVSHSEVIRWAKNPIEVSQYKTNHVTRSRSCSAKVCALPFGEHETRYMRCCTEQCPDKYPWLDNPEGKSQ